MGNFKVKNQTTVLFNELWLWMTYDYSQWLSTKAVRMGCAPSSQTNFIKDKGVKFSPEILKSYYTSNSWTGFFSPKKLD